MKKKYALIIALVVVTLSILGLSIRKKIVRAENEVLAKEIRRMLMGCTFEGENRSTKSVDKGGAIKLTEFTDTKVVCRIGKEGNVTVVVKKSYCDGTAVTYNGNIVYDKVDETEKEYILGEVEVPLSGNIKVEIGNQLCSLVVDEQGNPIQIVMEGILCNLK